MDVECTFIAKNLVLPSSVSYKVARDLRLEFYAVKSLGSILLRLYLSSRPRDVKLDIISLSACGGG
jgi:hypothetical protein